ncbi:MAG: hypothetical protein EBT63_06425, partial [Proteobacteria bacterium]|nr:hypothetical protein [Pseudomonadota bacterium]
YDEATRINDYKEKLEKLSEDEFEKLYKELVKKKEAIRRKDEELRQEKINQREYEWFLDPKYNADFDYWLKADYWSVEECLALAFGKNPRLINFAKIINFQHSINVSSKFVLKYLENFDLVERSINYFSLGTMICDKYTKTENKKVKPLDFINWAKSKNIELPKGLSELTKQDENNIKEIEVKFTSLQEKYNQLSLDKAGLKQQNEELQKKLSEKEDSRVIATLNKILCGIIKGRYSDESSRVSKIKSTLMREANIDLNEKTIRTRLQEALKEDKSKE